MDSKLHLSRNWEINFLSAVKRAMAHFPHHKKPQPKTIDEFDPIEKELLEISSSSHEILFKANTVFPFDLFPDTVVIDREKITIAERFFFFTANITSVPIRDILSVEVDIGPFFGSIKMTSRYFYTNPESIRFLWRSDAIELQRLLQGYIIANERNIDCRSVDNKHLKTLLLDLGQGNISSR